jgi:alkylation response protein AidB-like acyl-CoA dehydrogenase
MNEIAITPRFDARALSSYLESNVDPYILQWDEQAYFPMEVFQSLHQLGIMGSSLPIQLGGQQLKMIDLLGIAAELAFHAPGIFSSWIGGMLAQTAIARFADPKVAAQVSAEHLRDRTVMSFCATELETGTDVIHMLTTASETADGYRITGKKHFITNLNFARHLVVFAKIRFADGTSEPGISAFYVPASAEGFHVGAPLKKLGQHESNTGQAEFRDVFVPKTHLLGKQGSGYDILSSCISRTKTLISGASVGVCRRAERDALRYLSETVRYGEPLLARKEIQAVLSHLRTRMDAAWLLGARACAVWDEKGTAVYEASMAKLFAADMAVDFVNEAAELMGASGYMQETFLCKLYRDVKLFEIYEGASLVQQALIGKEIYGPLLKRQIKNPYAKKAA